VKKLAGLVLSILLAITAITGCITTNIKGFTDLDYSGYKLKRVVVRAPNTGFTFGERLATSMTEEFNKNGIYVASFLAMLPPTREWTNEEVAKE